MASVNKVILVGHLGRDPDTRYSPDGSAITNVSVATSNKWKDKSSGDMKEETEWHRVTFFGRLAEIAEEYLSKGSLCYVEGRLKTRKYKDKEGVEKYATDIIAERLQLLGGKKEGGGESGGGRSESRGGRGERTEERKEEPAARSGRSAPEFDDPDIPF